MTTKEVFESLTREEGISFFNNKKTDKEVYDILVSKGLTDSFETFKVEAQKLFTEKVSAMSTDEILNQIEGAELTEEELAQIAGGKWETRTIVGATVGGAGIVSLSIALAFV